MPINCYIRSLKPKTAETLRNDPSKLAQTIAATKYGGDVYYYWDAIDYMLAQDGSENGRFLTVGGLEIPTPDDLPPARLFMPEEVKPLAEVFVAVDLEGLGFDFDHEAADAAGIYPRRWAEFEDNDVLGDMLEALSHLQAFVKEAAKDGEGLLVHFTRIEDMTDF